MEHEPGAASKFHLEKKSSHIDRASRPDYEATPPCGKPNGIWGEDLPATPRYNYASEKSLSHADAKLFYQRYKLEASQQDEAEPHDPLARVGTASSNSNDELEGLSRAGSTASRRSGYGGRPRRSAKLSTHSELSHLDEPTMNRVLTPTDLNDPDTYRRRETIVDDLGSSNFLAENQVLGTEAGTEAGVTSSSSITPELCNICSSIWNVLETRRKYIGLSLQRPADNPKNETNWKLYPPPPEPVWDDLKDRPSSLNSGSNSLSNSKILSPDHVASQFGSPISSSSHPQRTPISPMKRPRKPGQDIGEDFEMSDLLPLPGEEEALFKLDKNSVYQVYKNANLADLDSPIVKVPTLRDFYYDLDHVKDVSSDGPSKSFAFRELDILEGKFNLYFLVNEYEETATCKRVPHRDFYNVRKVDTHVHHSSCMNQKHLLRFIKSKMKKSPDEIVLFRDGKHLTLKEVFESINLTAYDLSIDTLDMHVC